MAQRIYRLTSCAPFRTYRARTRGNRGRSRLLVAWVGAFAAEAMPEGAPDRGAERTVDARLRAGASSFTIWEDGDPVSLAGWGGPTPNGVRIGPVYTPPEHRRRGIRKRGDGRGYGRAAGCGPKFCFLYTDLANPTSNKIYMDIGYEPVCDAVDYAFEPCSCRFLTSRLTDRLRDLWRLREPCAGSAAHSSRRVPQRRCRARSRIRSAWPAGPARSRAVTELRSALIVAVARGRRSRRPLAGAHLRREAVERRARTSSRSPLPSFRPTARQHADSTTCASYSVRSRASRSNSRPSGRVPERARRSRPRSVRAVRSIDRRRLRGASALPTAAEHSPRPCRI